MLNRFRYAKFINPLTLFLMVIFDVSFVLTLFYLFAQNQGAYSRSMLVMFFILIVLFVRRDISLTPRLREVPCPEAPESVSPDA
jgi:hypothetical protein